MAAPQTVAPDTTFQQHRAFLLMSPVWARCSCQGLAVAAALGESKPEPRSLGPTLKDGLAAPGGWEGGPERRLEPLAEQDPLVASRGWCCLTLDPAEALCTSLGALEAGFDVLSLSGDQEPLDQASRPERQQQQPAAGAQDCPRVMLPVAPRKAGPN